ncbi:MAG: hypothetical protein ABR534_15285 [Desulfotignum sp.]
MTETSLILTENNRQHFRYNVKLRNAGYRLVYEVRKKEIVIVVLP